ncbi:MAG: hypothetical protein CM15mP65_10660 [Crocinitomicaceae bacterium]|nr:MAG: hypothetical protein CM15mP65_10660 [Crocinitomicaceae bacterium]
MSNCHQCGNPCDNHTNCKTYIAIYFSFNVINVKKNIKIVAQLDVLKLLHLAIMNKKWRAGKENKKIFHSHRKVDLKNKL